jgi:uncharacterized protein
MRDVVDQMKADFRALDRRAAFALVYTAVGLTAVAYLKNPFYLDSALSRTPLAWMAREAIEGTDTNLYALGWWVVVSVTFYFVIPALAVRFIQGRRLTEIGLAHKLEPGFAKLLAVSIVIMLPLVYFMSLTTGFSTKYPFLHVYNGAPYLSSALLIWELIYFVQFFGLEFFFRGFLVHSLKPTIGAYSVLVMTVPYTMIHFQKPMAEAFAAVAAGLFLGWISYRNGTIWLGLILHCTVAFSMDILALYNKGLLS